MFLFEFLGRQKEQGRPYRDNPAGDRDNSQRGRDNMTRDHRDNNRRQNRDVQKTQEKSENISKQ